MPGIDGAHEKGGVEGEVGRFRRNHLRPDARGRVAWPSSTTRIDIADAGEDRRRIDNRIRRPSGTDFALEAAAAARRCRPRGSRPGLTLTPRVDRYAPDHGPAMPSTRCRSGSSAAGSGCSLRASELVVFDGRTEVAGTPASVPRGLADAGAGPLSGGAAAQARCVARCDRSRRRPAPPGTFTATHEAFWAAARTRPRRRRPAPARWSRCCCCTATSRRSTSSPGSPPPCPSARASADVVAVEARKAAQLPSTPTRPTAARRRARAAPAGERVRA